MKCSSGCECVFRLIELFYFLPETFNFRQELVAVSDSRGEYRPAWPLHEIGEHDEL